MILCTPAENEPSGDFTTNGRPSSATCDHGECAVTIRVFGSGTFSRRSSSSRKTLLLHRMMDCESSITGMSSASARSANWNDGSVTPVSERMKRASYSGRRRSSDAPMRAMCTFSRPRRARAGRSSHHSTH
jgi:hypothetical protein